MKFGINSSINLVGLQFVTLCPTAEQSEIVTTGTYNYKASKGYHYKHIEYALAFLILFRIG